MSDDSVRFLVEFIHGLLPESTASAVPKVRNDENARVANIKKMDRIALLQDNWNGNGAKAIPETLVLKVRNLLETIDFQPDIFPTACDTIQFEYDMQNGGHLEIEISEDDRAECFMIDADGRESSEEIMTDAASINRKVTEFYG